MLEALFFLSYSTLKKGKKERGRVGGMKRRKEKVSDILTTVIHMLKSITIVLL